MPRSRGMVVGLCLVVLGIWGAIIPFVGPYFHYAFINLQRWHFTYGRLWLDILPGAATFFAGILLRSRRSRHRPVRGLDGSGGGSVVRGGPQISRLWNHGLVVEGQPFGGHTRQTFEQLGYLYALGAAILLLAGIAIGRASLIAARDVLGADRRGRPFRRGARRAPPVAPVGAGAAREPTRSVGPRRPISRDRATTPQTPPAEGPPSTGGDVPA